jgi:hypothetical protein
MSKFIDFVVSFGVRHSLFDILRFALDLLDKGQESCRHTLKVRNGPYSVRGGKRKKAAARCAVPPERDWQWG